MSTRKPLPPTPLRDAAEARLAHQSATTKVATSPAAATAQLQHELDVHHIELEMQNESLRQAQLALEESRDRYVDLYEMAPVGYLSLSPHGQITAINLTGATLLGGYRQNLLRRRFGAFVADDDAKTWQRHFRQALGPGGARACELKLRRPDGSAFTAHLDFRVGSDAGTPTLWMTLSDVSERQNAVAELRVANERLEDLALKQAEHLRELAGELTRAEQRQRDRLYERLHDDMQPLLVAARLALSSCQKDAPPEGCTQAAAVACNYISQVIHVARALSLELSPPLIRERGLIPALESLCRWVKANHGLSVALSSTPATEPDDLALRLICFNAARELLMNVVKHAGTTRVTLTLSCPDPDRMRMTLSDDGVGFDPEALTNGSGLSGIARRLGMFGGSLQIDSRPGAGTTITLLAPLRPVTAAGWLGGARERRGKTGDKHVQDPDRR